MRPGTRPTGPAGRRGDGRGWWWARSRAGQAAGTGRPGGGSAASPSAARSRRTAWGSVTAPRIRRGPQFGPETAIKLPRAFGARSGDRWTLQGPGRFDSAGRPVATTSHGLGGRRVRHPPNSRCVAMNWRITVRELCGDGYGQPARGAGSARTLGVSSCALVGWGCWVSRPPLTS